ncbi:uncharacterized protein [Procambarus clarkii]|uniref:uncharacterized protein n=1 Tax=Procambarus clarkii TaxID=6728 RepID=UPI003742BC8F
MAALSTTTHGDVLPPPTMAAFSTTTHGDVLPPATMAALSTNHGDVRQFFSSGEWQNLAPIEKTRYENLYKGYCLQKDLGINVKVPSFMVKLTEGQQQRGSRHQRQSCNGPSQVMRERHRRRCTGTLPRGQRKRSSTDDDDDDDDEWTPEVETRSAITRSIRPVLSVKSRFVVPRTVAEKDTSMTPFVRAMRGGGGPRITRHQEGQTAFIMNHWRHKGPPPALSHNYTNDAPLSTSQEYIVNLGLWMTATLQPFSRFGIKVVPTEDDSCEAASLRMKSPHKAEQVHHGNILMTSDDSDHVNNSTVKRFKKSHFTAGHSRNEERVLATCQPVSVTGLYNTSSIEGCENCGQDWQEECPLHPFILILDNPVLRDGSVQDRARLTTPWPLSICPSKLKDAGLGVWTNAELTPRLVFGPYEGRILNNVQEGHESGYGWQLRGQGGGRTCVDGVDASVSNWMRYVNCSTSQMEANLAAFQYKRQIYYKTKGKINRGAELMVWYGDEYASELGLSREVFQWCSGDTLKGYDCEMLNLLCSPDQSPLKGNTCEQSPLNRSTGKQSPLKGNTGEQSPLKGNTGEQSPLKGSTGEQSPTKGSTGEQSALKGSTGEQSALKGSTGEQSPLKGSTGEQSPLKGSTGEQSPLKGSTGEQSPLKGSTGEQSPLKGSTGEQSPLKGSTGEQSPLKGSTGEQSPLKGSTGEQSPLKGSTGEQSPLKGSTGEQSPLKGSTGEQSPLKGSTGEQSPLKGSTGEQSPLKDSTGEQPPLKDSTGEQPPLKDSTGEQSPLKDSTGEQPPLKDSTGEQSPLKDSTGEQSPLKGNTGEQSPLKDSTGEQSPLKGNTGEQSPLKDSTGEQSPLKDSTGEQSPLKGSTGEQSPLKGNTGEQLPLKGNTGEQSPLKGSTGEQSPLKGSTGEQSPLKGSTGEQELDTLKIITPAEGTSNDKLFNKGYINANSSHNVLQQIEHFHSKTNILNSRCVTQLKRSNKNRLILEDSKDKFEEAVDNECKSEIVSLGREGGYCFDVLPLNNNGSQVNITQVSSNISHEPAADVNVCVMKPHECPECGKRFTQLGSMKRHRLIHTGDRPHECPECGKSFTQLGNMKNHRLVHTGEKPHECPECGKRFNHLGHMKTHRLIHTGDKSHKCPECGKTFTQMGYMKTHRLVHTGDKPHKCPECGKRFKWLGYMKTHRMVHTGDKSHECPECGKTFTQMGYMKTHRLVHTGEKPHECPECGKRFTQMGYMKTHRLVHTGDKPHECPECGKRFTQLGNMKKHKSTHKPDKT